MSESESFVEELPVDQVRKTKSSAAWEALQALGTDSRSIESNNGIDNNEATLEDLKLPNYKASAGVSTLGLVAQKANPILKFLTQKPIHLGLGHPL